MTPPRLKALQHSSPTTTSISRSTTTTRTSRLTPSPPCTLVRLTHLASTRSFTTTRSRQQELPTDQNYNFYRTHGRAFFKTFTLAFLTYQVLYWSWLTLEAEEEKDAKNAQIKSLEGEIRLLREGRGSHTAPGSVTEGRRILDEAGEDGSLLEGLGAQFGGGLPKDGGVKEEAAPGKNQGQDIDGMLIPGVKGKDIR
ncbi:uncharacterized protein AB675_705 [Cyphellophora attinorum]|uniref:Inner membrane assembly complex subunit 17 n=1 Tax=Cyphellophora attinorum TaxID=1664694 RepID=A0A0N1P3F2_9EURO|nr:uncharacterized protein AB675_705 [Phialophora attinorum]KPI45412.1 hypothetical protein AB675_705 [Phialophora attinorum]